MQTAILITLFAFAYLILLIQYRKANGNGAKGLSEILAGSGSLYHLNSRTLSTAPPMLMTILVCLLISDRPLLRPSFPSWQMFETIFLTGLCCLVSVASAITGPTPHRSSVTRKEKIRYFSIRIPGLIIYEFFFRGVLFGLTMQFLSVPFSIALNVILYAFAHVSCERKEFAGSILFGLALCYTAIRNQSVYPCALMHLSIALPYEMILLNNYQHTIKNLGL